MKRSILSSVSMPDLSIPDVAVPSAPDVSGIADSLLELAESAADAVSSAAGHVPGLDDYRASTRRRNTMLTVGSIVAVVALVVYVKRRSSSNGEPNVEANR